MDFNTQADLIERERKPAARRVRRTARLDDGTRIARATRGTCA